MYRSVKTGFIKGIPVSFYSIEGFKKDAVCIHRSEQSWIVYVVHCNTKDNPTEYSNVVEACIGVIRATTGGNIKIADKLIDSFFA